VAALSRETPANERSIPVRRNRDLLVVVAGCTVSVVGAAMASTTLFLHLAAIGAGTWAITGVLTAQAVPTVLLAPLAGQLVDRCGARAIIIASSGWQAATCLGIAARPPTWLLLLLVAGLGSGTAAAGPAFVTLLSQLVHRDQITRAISLLTTATGTAAVAGPALAGVMFEATGLTGAFLIDGVSCLAVTASAALIRTRRSPDRTSNPRIRALDGLRTLFGDPTLRRLAVVLVGFSTTLQAVEIVEVYLVRETLGQPAAVYGGLVSTWTVTALLGSALAGLIRTLATLSKLFAGSSVVLVGSILAVAAVPVLPAVFAAFAVGGLANGMLTVTAMSLLTRYAPEAERGRVVAMLNGLVRGGGLGALALGGVLASTLDPRQVYGLAGLAAGALLAVVLPSMLRQQHARRAG
jgi:MFS family permease